MYHNVLCVHKKFFSILEPPLKAAPVGFKLVKAKKTVSV